MPPVPARRPTRHGLPPSPALLPGHHRRERHLLHPTSPPDRTHLSRRETPLTRPCGRRQRHRHRSRREARRHHRLRSCREHPPIHACDLRWHQRRNRCQPHPMHGPGHRQRQRHHVLRFDLPQRARCHPAPGERHHHPVDHQSEQSRQLPSGRPRFDCCQLCSGYCRLRFERCRLCSGCCRLRFERCRV